MKHSQAVADLELKNRRTLAELEKVTAQLFQARDDNKALMEAMEEKKHSEQLGGWAIDRAIEIAKLKADPKDIIAIAQQICDGVKLISAKQENAT